MTQFRPVAFVHQASIRYSACKRKKRFWTKEEAERAHGAHRVYHCPHCDGWHLTSRGQQRRTTE